MPITLRVTHRTIYRFDRPVTFGPHRLMIRPRGGHDQRLMQSSLVITPPASIRWHFDPFGNSIAVARFSEPADALSIESMLLLRRYPGSPAILNPDSHATPWPFHYDEDESIDLAPFMALENPQDEAAVTAWLETHLPLRSDEALTLLRALGDTIHAGFAYSRRDELGTQSAATTLGTGGGTCRDFALFFMEAARVLGCAARFVTGYLHDPGTGEDGLLGGGATHAWADVFLPGEGWIEFDPTNRIVGGRRLIRVATTRSPAQASPITGTYTANGAEYLGMEVGVSVVEEETT